VCVCVYTYICSQQASSFAYDMPLLVHHILIPKGKFIWMTTMKNGPYPFYIFDKEVNFSIQSN